MIEDEVTEADAPNAEKARLSFLDSWRFWAPRAAFEAALIVGSLLLALWLSDWQDARRQDRAVAETREALVAEIRANREMLVSDNYMGHHRRLQGSMQQALGAGDDLEALREGAFAMYRTGIHLPEMRDTVWRTASTTGVLAHMDREELEALTDVYGSQDALTRSITAYYPQLLQLPHYANDAGQLQGAMVGVMMFMGDLTSGEEQIVRRQTEALQVLGAEPRLPQAGVPD